MRLYLKLKVFIFLFIAFLIPFLVFIPVNNVKAATCTNVSVQTAYEITTNHTQYPNLLILDVREQHEYNESHLHNATLIPLGEINTRISELEPYNNTEIIVTVVYYSIIIIYQAIIITKLG